MMIKDTFPDKICEKCVDSLLVTYKFRKRCEESNLKLVDYFNEIKVAEEAKKKAEKESEEKVKTKIKKRYREKDSSMVNEKNVCKKCKKIFLHASSLKIHMMRHNGIKNHKCHICAKAFTTSHSLKTHILLHTGEKKFECSECKKLFITKDALQKHSRKHTGEKVHLCSICGKGYEKIHSSNYIYIDLLYFSGIAHSGRFKHICASIRVINRSNVNFAI